MNALFKTLFSLSRGGLTRGCRKGGRLEPRALLLLTELRAVLAGASGNSRGSLRVRRAPLRVIQRPWREARARVRGGARSPTGALLGNQRLDAEREAAPLVLLLRRHVFGLRVRLLLRTEPFGVPLRMSHHTRWGFVGPRTSVWPARVQSPPRAFTQ